MILRNMIYGFKISLKSTISIVSLFFSIVGLGQNDFWQRVNYGGGIGLGIGNRSFNVQLSPTAIYNVNNTYATGASLQVNYLKIADDRLLGYGASWINLINPIPEIQLSTDLEQWRVNEKLETQGITFEDNYWITSLFLGIGYRTNNVIFGLRYDVLYDENRSLYADPLLPFVRVFF